jgi:signal transduction histidine kinase
MACGAPDGPGGIGMKASSDEERIVEATLRLIIEKGYESTSIDDVAKEAGLTRGILTTYFKSKEDLARAALFRACANVYVDSPPGDPNSTSTFETLKEMLTLNAPLHELLVNLVSVSRHNPEIAAALAELMRSDRAFIDQVVDRLLPADGKDVMSPRAVAGAIWAAALGIAVANLVDPDFDAHGAFDGIRALCQALLLQQVSGEVNTSSVTTSIDGAYAQVNLRMQVDELRQSRARLLEAGDKERRRVERDLHDGAQQQLVSLLLTLQLARAGALERLEVETAGSLDRAINGLKQALTDLRELARGIHPTILGEAGLLPAISSLAERCPLRVEISGDPGRLQSRLEVALYFVAAEAITNAVKHSRARNVDIALGRNDALASIDVSDDGVGGAHLTRGTGLIGLSDRIAAVGGHFEIRDRPGHGVHIHAEVPCA